MISAPHPVDLDALLNAHAPLNGDPSFVSPQHIQAERDRHNELLDSTRGTLGRDPIADPLESLLRQARHRARAAIAVFAARIASGSTVRSLMSVRPVVHRAPATGAERWRNAMMSASQLDGGSSSNQHSPKTAPRFLKRIIAASRHGVSATVAAPHECTGARG